MQALFEKIQKVFEKRPHLQEAYILDKAHVSFSKEHVEKHKGFYKEVQVVKRGDTWASDEPPKEIKQKLKKTKE